MSPLDLARNLGLLIACQFAFFAPSPVEPELWGIVAVAAVGLVAAASLRSARRRLPD